MVFPTKVKPKRVNSYDSFNVVVSASEVPETPRKEGNSYSTVRPWQCQAALAVAQCCFCIGTVYLKSRLQVAERIEANSFHPIIYAFLREAVAGPIMIAISWGTSGTFPKRQDWAKIVLLGILLYFNQLFYIIGIDLSGVVVATCMQPTIPVFTAMIAVCLQMERGSIQKFLGIGLAVGGSMCMVLGGVSSAQHPHTAAGDREARLELVGNCCLLANTLSMSGYYLVAKQLVQKYSAMTCVAAAYVTAAICMGGTALATVERSAWRVPPVLLGPLVYWIVVCSVMGYFVVTWATQYLPASQVAAFQCLQPFVGTLLAFLVLGEEPSAWDLGSVGVVAGLLLVTLDRGDHSERGQQLMARIRRILSQSNVPGAPHGRPLKDMP